MAGTLIGIEGIDGSGKSTMVRRMMEMLAGMGKEVARVATREEGHEALFNSVLQGYQLDPTSPGYMFFFQMLHAAKVERARKALGQGKVVVADRWDLSFYVYHSNFGFFAEESPEVRDSVSELAFRGLSPSLSIYLDVSVDTAFDRRQWRGEAMKDIEKERSFYNVVTHSYRDLAEQRGWVIVDANDGFEGVAKEVWDLVRNACS